MGLASWGLLAGLVAIGILLIDGYRRSLPKKEIRDNPSPTQVDSTNPPKDQRAVVQRLSSPREAGGTAVVPTPVTAALDSKPAQTDMSPTYLGPRLRIQGDITTGDAIHIAGRINGRVVVDGQPLTLLNSGVAGPQVTAAYLELHGEATGDIVVEKRVHIASTARFTGTLQASTARCEPGAALRGDLRIGTC
ncbi:bactofilin family protein [Salinicola aestuarinus]|uniref:bactofilin family protein n=1 Tax=Salinicola aestuarinus TaxID=1949082 RepID=UPI0013006F3A|nr:polymer-forming cytoskeletal protein [Salinicola aestuarinus]